MNIWFYHTVLLQSNSCNSVDCYKEQSDQGPKDADGMANSVDCYKEQFNPGLSLFAQTCLSENIDALQLFLHLREILTTSRNGSKSVISLVY